MAPPMNSNGSFTNNSASTAGGEFRTFLISYYDIYMIQFVVNIIIIPLVSIFGTFGNIANIVVYIKMGFQQATNIMFLALSIADLFIVLSYLVGTCAVNTLFDGVNTLFYNLDDLLMIINPFVWAFLGFSSMITALIAVERSVCIVLPLKVKTLFTPRRTCFALLGLSILPLATLISKYLVMEMEWIRSPTTNRSLLALVKTDQKVFMDYVSALAFSTIPSLLSLIVVIAGTIVMVVKLNQNVRWRQTASQSAGQNNVSAREVKVVRSVMVVCIVFIVCFTPNALMIILAASDPSLHMSNPYYGPFVYGIYSLTNFFQAVSSSVNILIYLTTSMNYKETFMATFLCKPKKA